MLKFIVYYSQFNEKKKYTFWKISLWTEMITNYLKTPMVEILSYLNRVVIFLTKKLFLQVFTDLSLLGIKGSSEEWSHNKWIDKSGWLIYWADWTQGHYFPILISMCFSWNALRGKGHDCLYQPFWLPFLINFGFSIWGAKSSSIPAWSELALLFCFFFVF